MTLLFAYGKLVVVKVVILYRPNSEHARSVETYVRDFERQRGKPLELVSLDSAQGADMARLYDATSYPAVLALRDNGEMLNIWQGEQLPLMNEVAGYLDR